MGHEHPRSAARLTCERSAPHAARPRCRADDGVAEQHELAAAGIETVVMIAHGARVPHAADAANNLGRVRSASRQNATNSAIGHQRHGLGSAGGSGCARCSRVNR